MTQNSNQQVVASTRISEALRECLIQSLRENETSAQFIAEAIENEVSRRKLCKPPKKITLEQLEDKLEKMHAKQELSDTRSKSIDAKLDYLLKAAGLEI